MPRCLPGAENGMPKGSRAGGTERCSHSFLGQGRQGGTIRPAAECAGRSCIDPDKGRRLPDAQIEESCHVRRKIPDLPRLVQVEQFPGRSPSVSFSLRVATASGDGREVRWPGCPCNGYQNHQSAATWAEGTPRNGIRAESRQARLLRIHREAA